MVTARSESKAEDFAQRRSRFKDLLEVTITGDLSAVGAFDDLAKDVDVIIHCASVSSILVLGSLRGELLWNGGRRLHPVTAARSAWTRTPLLPISAMRC